METINKVKVESSNIDFIAYDYETKRIIVWFKNGGVYSYNNVPEEIYGEFLAAESKGVFLNAKIKPTYSFSQILIPELNLKLTGFPAQVIQWLNLSFTEFPANNLQQKIVSILTEKIKEVATLVLANCAQDDNRTKALEALKTALLYAKESVVINPLEYDVELKHKLAARLAQQEKAAQASTPPPPQIIAAPQEPTATTVVQKAEPAKKTETKKTLEKPAAKKRGRPKKIV